MKKSALFALLMLCVTISIAQPSQYTPMTAQGYQFKRILTDSTLHLPSFCGVPTLRNSTAKNGALAVDTCNNNLYKWTNQAGWTIVGGSSIDTTSLSNRINAKIDSIYRSADSVYYTKNGVAYFAYIDSTGGAGGTSTGVNGLNGTTNIGLGGALTQDTYIDANSTGVESLAIGFQNTLNAIWLQANSIHLQYPNTTTDTNTYKPLVIDPASRIISNLDYYPSQSSNAIDSIKRNPGTDSVFAYKNGQWVYQFKDSIGISNGGGGGGKIYYFNGGVNLGTFGGITMYELGDTAVTGTAADFTKATTGNIANFITDLNKPGLLQIPAGVWTIDAYFSETGGGSNHAQIYAILEKWNGSTLTVIATSPVEEITNGNVKDLYTFGISVPTTTLSISDRIVIQFYIQNTNGKTVTLYTQNGNVGEVHTTFTTGIGALNGLTAPTQTFAVGTSGTDFNISSTTSTHTFNLPTASATNRGALSSTDWSTFNNKLNTSDTAAMLQNYQLKTPSVAYLISDYTTTNTTATNTNLSIPVEANTTYRIMITGSAAKAVSSTGLKVAIGAPTGTTIKAWHSYGTNSINTLQNSFITSVNSLGSTFATGIGIEVPFRIEGILVTGSSAGNIVLQAATVTSNTATIYANTLMTVTKSYGL
jgi:hypothetical protein